jgi:zinc protease
VTWSGKADQPKIPVEPAQMAERRASVTWAQPTKPRLLIGYKVPEAADRKSAAALDVIYAYLFGATGTLHKSLVLERQIAEPFQEWSQAHRDPGIWALLATGKAPADLAEIERAVDAALADLQAGRIDEALLAGIKSNRRYGLLLGLEDPEAVAELLSWTVSVTGDLDAVDRYMAALDALTPADVAAFARERLVPAGRTVVTLTQGGATK